MDGNAPFADGERALLRMETPPLRVGNVLFADGNAAVRTFGRAHRRRPYHFSYGSCHKIAGRGSADGLKRKRLPEEALPTD